MKTLEDTLNVREKAALERCDAQIRWYDQHTRRSQNLSNVFQVATIVLGALTPVLLLWGTALPVALQALPSALAAVAAGVSAIFHWGEDRTRFASTREALKSERFKFLTRTTEAYQATLDDQQALGHFMARIEGLALHELVEWQQIQQIKHTPPKRQPSPGEE